MRTIFVAALLVLGFVSQAHAFNSAGGAYDSVGILSTGQTSVAVSASAALALAANPNRKFLYIQNIGATNPAQCKFGGTFTSTEGFVLAAGATFQPGPAITTSIWCKSASGTTVNFIEGIQ